MELLLTSKRSKTGALVLHIPLALRISILAIGLIIIAASLIPSSDGAQSHLGVTTVLLCIVLLLGALYEERWTFDPATRAIKFRFGLLFLAKTMSIPYDQVDEIRVERAMKGTMQPLNEQTEPTKPTTGLFRLFQPKVFINLVLYLNHAERVVIESGSARREDQLITLKNQIQEVISPT